MGLLNMLTGGIVGALFGGDEKVKTPEAVKPAEDTKTAQQVADENDAKRKAALLAANAGGNNSATTVGGGNADVTRKNILGL